MPNHTKNILKTKRLDLVLNEKGEVDFNVLVPIPQQKDFGFLRDNLTEENVEKYDDNWYDWSIKNWGTKWNAYDLYGESTLKYICGREGDEINLAEVEFTTAWTPPRNWFYKLKEQDPDAQLLFNMEGSMLSDYEVLDLETGRISVLEDDARESLKYSSVFIEDLELIDNKKLVVRFNMLNDADYEIYSRSFSIVLDMEKMNLDWFDEFEEEMAKDIRKEWLRLDLVDPTLEDLQELANGMNLYLYP